MTFCHQVCLVRIRVDKRQVSFASSPRYLARTCTSTLHVSSDLMSSQIDCRHGSGESLHVPVLCKRCFVTILSAIPVVRVCNSASAELKITAGCVLEHAEGVALPLCVTAPLVLLRESGAVLSSRCLCTRSRTDQTLCSRDTFEVSCDALHVHLVALSGTEDLSCCFLHAVHDVSTHKYNCFLAAVLYTPRFSFSSLTSDSLVGVLFRLGVATGLESSRPKHGNHVSDVLGICLNRVSTSLSHDHFAKKENLIAQSLQSPRQCASCIDPTKVQLNAKCSMLGPIRHQHE